MIEEKNDITCYLSKKKIQITHEFQNNSLNYKEREKCPYNEIAVEKRSRENKNKQFPENHKKITGNLNRNIRIMAMRTKSRNIFRKTGDSYARICVRT